MASRYISQPVEKILFANSGGRCAFCQKTFYKIIEDQIAPFYRIAHIRGLRPGSARYDPAYPEEKLNDYENLIILCANCHDIVDSAPEQFTVEELDEMKKLHEKKVDASIRKELLAKWEAQPSKRTSIPSCLQLLSQAVPDRAAISREVKTGKPDLVDFTSGRIVRRGEYIADVFSGLRPYSGSEAFKASLITGPSGCGKTTLALQIGIDLRDDDWLVLYTDAETTELLNSVEEICQFLMESDGNTLLVVDNCHVNPEPTRLMIQKLERSNGDKHDRLIRLLLTGRIPGGPNSPLRSRMEPIFARCWETPLEVTTDFIGKLAQTLGEDVTSSETDLSQMLRNAGNDLPLICTALQQLTEKGEIDWEDLSDFAIDWRLRNVDFTEKKKAEILILFTSVFTRMHCFPSHRFLMNYLKDVLSIDSNTLVNQLLKEGHLSTHMVDRELVVSAGHPSIADLLLKHLGERLLLETKRAGLTSVKTINQLEMKLWLDYFKYPPPDIGLFLVNLTMGLLERNLLDPAMRILDEIEDTGFRERSLHAGVNNIALLLSTAGRKEEAERAFKLALDLDESGIAWANYGNFLSSIGKLEESISAHERACKMLPDTAIVHSQLGNSLTSAGRMEEAEKAHSRAVNLEPDNPLVWTNFGAYYSDRNLLDDALDALKKAIEADSRWIDAHIALAKVYMRLSRLQDAKRETAKAWSLDPHDFIQLIDLSALLMANGRRDLAEAAVREALQRAPNSADAFYVLGMILLQKRQCKEVKTEYEVRSPLVQTTPGMHLAVADVLRECRLYELAQREYQVVIERNWEVAEAHYGLAMTYHSEGSYAKAENQFKLASQKGYTGRDLSHDRCLNLMFLNQIDEALEVLEDCPNLKDSPEGYFLFGRLKTHTREYDEAIKAYRKSLRLEAESGKPTSRETWLNLGNSYLRKHQLRKAEIAYRKATEADPLYSRGWHMLAQVRSFLGEKEAAVEALERVREIEPDSPMALSNLASALTELGHFDDAYRMMRRAVTARRTTQENRLKEERESPSTKAKGGMPLEE